MVYLIHFDKPYKHARHYLGYVKRPDLLLKRFDRHTSGAGAKLLKVIAKEGIGFSIVRVWPDGDQTFERYLKNRKETPKLCPCCNPEAMKRVADKVSYFTEPDKVAI